MSGAVTFLDTMAKKPSVWMVTEGPMIHTVISSRIRLARNIAGHRFCQKAKTDELESILQKIINAAKFVNKFQGSEIIHLEGTTQVDRKLLLERHLVSQEHAKGGKAKAVIVGRAETNGMMINEEDHIRLQSIFPGFALQESWISINEIDNQLDQELPYAFTPEYGYLTACPTNVGTGIRASVMVHLPALSITKQIEGILQKATQAGLAIRGLYGEGSESVGDIYQFSNQITLGQIEEDMISTVETYVKQIIVKEQNCRKQLLKDAKAKVEDVIYRAYGILSQARLINSRESMKLLSHLRLGIHYEWINLSFLSLNELMLLIQPAHLQKAFGLDLDETQRDIFRAELIRSKICQN